MVEAGVNDAVRKDGPTAQALQVFQVAAVHFGTRGEQRPSALVRAGEAEHLMAGTEQFRDDGGTDEASGSGDEYTHDNFFLFGGGFG